MKNKFNKLVESVLSEGIQYTVMPVGPFGNDNDIKNKKDLKGVSSLDYPTVFDKDIKKTQMKADELNAGLTPKQKKDGVKWEVFEVDGYKFTGN